MPNLSLKRSANGRPPVPGWRYAVHFHQPGPAVLPSSPDAKSQSRSNQLVNSNSKARRQRNVTGLWREMRAEAICRASQKMSDHRVAHIFGVARAFTPKSQHIALSPR